MCKVSERILAFYRKAFPQERIQEYQADFQAFANAFGKDALNALQGQELLRRIFGAKADESMAYFLESEPRYKKFGLPSGYKWMDVLKKKDGQWWYSTSAKNHQMIAETAAIDIATDFRDRLVRAIERIEELDQIENVTIADYLRLQADLKNILDLIYNRPRFKKYFAMLFPNRFMFMYDNPNKVGGFVRSYCNLLNVDIQQDWDWFTIGGAFSLRAKEIGLDTYALYATLFEMPKESDNQELTPIEEEEKPVKEKSVTYKNIILYGPPGTGKTYSTVTRAISIIEGKDYNAKDYETEESYKAAKAQYKALLGNQIEFVTFHQSYGYEEFITGIKPKTENGAVTYSVEEGTFKSFCERARRVVEVDGDLQITGKPKIWKVSLDGTGDNPVRTECLENGYIRIGWDGYGEDIAAIKSYTYGGKAILNAFYKTMKKGDVILSCYTEDTIDAIGIVDGDPEWSDDFDRLRRVRRVKWIVKNIRENIKEINRNKVMTLSTVYQLNIPLAEINEIIKRNTENAEKQKNYVFIIDEINRGNISKIFGELITLIEETKREGEDEEMSVMLPYSVDGKRFTVPNNVYIIGTMNTADRSIAVIDTALRRRFHFEEMTPDPDLLDMEIEGIHIKQMLEKMNERIEVLFDREHTIGHSFFLPLKKGGTLADLAEIFRHKIIPLLQEYFYEDYDKIRLVLADNQKQKDEQFILKTECNYRELFGDNNELDDEPKATYRIQDDAFEKHAAYRKIYGGVSESTNENEHDADDNG